MFDVEALGTLYLGQLSKDGGPAPEPILLPSKDLTTHAVVVGMTGSGKTGLAVALLEEAALDGIPALVIDPKGDLANLALAFPDLAPGDFAPWVDPEEAARKGQTVDAAAQEAAKRWRDGLTASGQDLARVGRFRAAADVAVYTPGSSAGLPLAVLRSFEAPRGLEPEALAERVATTVSALLGLVGVDADPLRSREHLLLTQILTLAWAEERDLALADLVRAVQAPPFTQLGVLDLESFYPSKERFALVMSLNALLASPTAAAWTRGEPLDIARLFHTPEGRPRISVVSIAHLSDAERMFFVSTLLAEVVAWMRRQSGTSSLRALLFMDEIHGYFPPSAAPPSKGPMLTLLKQARAFGLGVVLATQNPVDLDYKGLANCGTWFVGRLQTERDKARLLDGLQAAAGGPDRAELDAMIAGLGSRVFLLHSVHAGAPRRFHTRQTLSYLRGPFTREQLGRLAAARPSAPASAPAAASPKAPSAPAGGGRPVCPVGLEEVYLGEGTRWRPHVYVKVRLHHVDARAGVDRWSDMELVAPLADTVDWAASTPAGPLRAAPAEGAWDPLPPAATRKQAAAEWKKAATSWLQQGQVLELRRAVGLVLEPGESEGAFRARVALAAREQRDAAVEALRAKMAPKLATLEERRRKAEARVEKEKAQAQAATVDTAISFGTTLFSALFGGRGSAVTKAASSARSATRTVRERGDIASAQDDLEAVEQAKAALAAEVEEGATEIAARFAPEAVVVETLRIAPRKADTLVERVALAWVGEDDAG